MNLSGRWFSQPSGAGNLKARQSVCAKRLAGPVTSSLSGSGLSIIIHRIDMVASNLQFDAVLEDWFVITTSRADLCYVQLIGTVWNDRKGRFRNGRMLRTSALLASDVVPATGAVVRTLNSIYLLGRPLSLAASVIH